MNDEKLHNYFIVRVQDLHTDAALELELQLNHVHFLVGAEFVELSAAFPHLIYGHINGFQLQMLLWNHLDPLLHIGESVRGCGRVYTVDTSETRAVSGNKKKQERYALCWS